jgi:DNA-binding response OmpR family regulator
MVGGEQQQMRRGQPRRRRALNQRHLQRQRLEPAERQVTVGGRLLDVPPREFDVLEYLLRHAGRALSRDAILERVWGPGEAPRANVVDATVSRLRRRLRSSGWGGRIAAVPGHGYRITAPDRRPVP